VLAAALSANRVQLQRLPFDRTTVALTEESGTGEATLDIQRQPDESGIKIR
jgi:hypothetical protein